MHGVVTLQHSHGVTLQPARHSASYSATNTPLCIMSSTARRVLVGRHTQVPGHLACVRGDSGPLCVEQPPVQQHFPRHRSYYWPAMTSASCKRLDEASVFGCSSVSSVESIEYWAGSARPAHPYVIPSLPLPPLCFFVVSPCSVFVLKCFRVLYLSPLFCFDLFTHI